jgi:hypothetical protein
LIGRTVTAGMPPSQADRLRDVVARALTWLALAGMALIAGGAALQAARLVFATARRTSTGPGLAGLAIVTLFALLAALTVFAPYLVRRDRWSPRAWLGAGLLLTAAVRLVTVLLIDAPLTVDGAEQSLSGYPRIDSPWAKVPWDSTTYDIAAGGETLHLDVTKPARRSSASL